MKKNRGVAIIALILVCLIGLGYFTFTIISGTMAKNDNSIKLGLDMSGGVSITYQIVDDNPSQTDIKDTKKKLEERAASYTVESAVYQQGDDRITVEIPGVYDANAVLEDLGSPGSLYFIAQNDDEGKANYTYDSSVEAYVLNKEIDELLEDGSILMTGDDVKAAEAVYQTDSFGNSTAVVELKFTEKGTDLFATATTDAALNSATIGIYYDDHFVSVPTVKSPIEGGECIIEGMDSYEKAEELATFIRIGAINLELKELESSVVGASLGSSALESSLLAAAVGLVVVMLFMIIMYRISGVAASIALAIYTTLVVSLVYIFEITLTLPGIAGVILGIGMAVDANVIIFARIREEIATGKSVLASINEGYKKAMSAIVDGNITTFIAAIVLMILGSGTVKGFAYTLVISIVVSMFTAIFVSKYLMKALYAVGLRSEKLYGRAKERKIFDFMKHKVIWFTISIVLIVAGFVGMGVYSSSGKRALNYSLEFVGGTSTTADFGKAYTIEEIESEIIPEVSKITGDSAITANTIDGTNQIVLKTRTLSLEERDELHKLLVDKYDVDEASIENQSISSTISGEMRKDAILAVIVACICMLLYIWFRFNDIRFATSAIIALVHDVLVVLTAYVLLRISVGGTFIACMLTIVGYSINDTIVIFDRIRENMRTLKHETKESLAEVANRSLTQTLSRSINTSITTFVMVLFLYILGVPAIQEFALPLMVGLIAGTYSSIFLATELWYLMKVHFGKKRLKE